MEINICSCLQCIRYVVQLNLLVRPEGFQVTERSAGSLLGTILKRASYKTLLYALQLVPYTSNGIPWTVVLDMHRTHYKHCSLIPPLVFNNTLTLLRCGYMCALTLVHISRHLGRTSNNNNKRWKLIIRCIFFRVCFHQVLLQISLIIILQLLTSFLSTCVLFHQSPILIRL